MDMDGLFEIVGFPKMEDMDLVTKAFVGEYIETKDQMYLFGVIVRMIKMQDEMRDLLLDNVNLAVALKDKSDITDEEIEKLRKSHEAVSSLILDQVG